MKRVATILACLAIAGCGSKDPGPPGPGNANPPAAAAAGGASLALPPGAVDGPGVVTLDPRERSGAGDAIVAGKVWDVRVDGREHVRFRRPAVLRLPYDPALVPKGLFATLAVRENGAWVPVTGATADAASKTVSARISHLSEYAPVLTAAEIVVSARWYGTYVRNVTDRDFPAGPPVYMVSGMTSTWTAKIEVREERLRDGSTENRPRFVIESVQIGLRYEGRIATVERDDGTHNWTLLEPLSFQMSKSEQELKKPVDQMYLAKVNEQRQAWQDAQRAVDEATRALDGASNREDAEYELKTRAQKLADELMQLRHMEFNLDSSWSDFSAGSNDGKAWANASVNHPEFKFTEVSWDLAGNLFELPSGQGVQVRKEEEIFQSFGAEGQEGQVLTDTKQHSDNNIRVTESSTFARVPMDGSPEPFQLKLGGTVLHRLLSGTGADQFIGESQGQQWFDVASRAIPVAGKARVEAFLVDMADPVEGPAVATVTTGADGAFEMTLPAKPEQELRLDVTWKNAEAQIEEHQYLQVPCWLAWAIAATIPEGAPPARFPDGARRGAVFTRFAGTPTMFDLGAEVRGGTVKRLGERNVELEFRKLDSILVGTACLRETHVNQNPNGPRIRIRARLDEIRAMLPEGDKEAAERRITAAGVDADGKVNVLVQGPEICFPSSTLVALDYLGYETLTLDAAGLTPQIGTFMQGVYNWFDGNMTAGRIGERWDNPDTGHWPCVDRDAADESMHWLMSIRDWRAWQDPDRLKRFLENNASYDGISFTKIDRDAFSEPGRKEYLSILPSGGSGIVRIPHEAAGIGHILAFAGVIIDCKGQLVRGIFQDPYGDLTRHPGTVGYHGGANRDVDPSGHNGRYAPYGNAPHSVNAHSGRIQTTWFAIIRRGSAAPSAADLRAKMLQGD